MSELNEQQYEAVYSDERLILCLAGAGAGKTKTLISRIERLVKKGVDPTSILSLTFTNAAAFEMKDRYKRLPGIDVSRGVPEFRTFHGFCYSLIVKDVDVRSRLGYSKIPELCDDDKMKEIKKAIKLKIGCTLTDAELDNDCVLSRRDQDQKDLFKKALVKEIKKQNVITFDMMCYNVCELFVKKEPCVDKYKQKYKYLCIDETQDSDPKQFKFIGSFPVTTHFFLVGDVLQSIYQFRGCTNEFIKQIALNPNWKIIKLYKNYRSTTAICDYANKFSRYSQDDFRIPMEGQRPGDPVEVVYGSNSTYNNPVDPNHLDILIEKIKANKNETAVLCRTNKECAAVKSALTDAEIEFSARTKSGDAINILESALSNDYMLEWLSTKLEAKDYGDYIRLAAQVDNPDIKWFLSMYGNSSTIKPSVEKVITVRNITATNDSPSNKFEQITKLLRSKTKCKFTGDDTWTNSQIVKDIRDQLQAMVECQVYVGTIHSSKGLEYDTVYVMGVDDKMFQLGSEEMNNLAYVAFTRPKNHLVVFRR